jgi:hypothetical protein
MFESGNPPILSLHVSSLTMSNFSPYKHKLKKFQHWPHSHVMIYMCRFQVHEQVMPPKKLALSSLHINYSIGLLFDCEIVCVSHV